MSDDLLKWLETGHDKECAMAYGMHEHCCDCSYPARQEAAARVRELEATLNDHLESEAAETMRADRERLRAERVEAERDALRALLREARESVSELVNWRDDDPEILARIDAALAGEKHEVE